MRAPQAGVLRSHVTLGASVERGDCIGTVSDPLGLDEVEVTASRSGVVIGRTELPLVNEGDALFHIATFDRPEEVAISVSDFQNEMEDFA